MAQRSSTATSLFFPLPFLSQLRRLESSFTSPLYRRAVWCRTLCRMLAKFSQMSLMRPQEEPGMAVAP